jgi:hypothetical protein
MVAYLLGGKADEAFRAIAVQLHVRLLKSDRW